MTDAAYRIVPHTADLMIEAWGPTRAACFEQAVRALVASFVDLETLGRAEALEHRLSLPPQDEDALIALLEEVVFLADARGVVPSRIEERSNGLEVALGLVILTHGAVTGAAPKAIAYHALSVERTPEGWRCRVTVDV